MNAGVPELAHTRDRGGVPAYHSPCTRSRVLEFTPRPTRPRLVDWTGLQHFGPYRLICPIGPLSGWDRWIALHELDDTDHVIYRRSVPNDANERRRAVATVDRLARVRNPHLLPVDAFSFDESGRIAFVTPYTGNQEGLLTIGDLLARRNGRLDLSEVERCVGHLLEAIAAGRSAGLAESGLDRGRILVDRRGSVLYEVYGLTGGAHDERGVIPESDEVRLAAQFAAWVLTGIDPAMAQVSVSRIAGRAARGWDAWISAATDPLEGFETVRDAIAALPTGPMWPGVPSELAQPRKPSAFGAVVRRFRRDPGHRAANDRS